MKKPHEEWTLLFSRDVRREIPLKNRRSGLSKEETTDINRTRTDNQGVTKNRDNIDDTYEK
jgi:hypothetical protein